jgi:rRNA maturation protein Rpf1
MSETAASGQTPNAGSSNTYLKVTIAALALAGIVTTIALIRTGAQRDAAVKRVQQLQEQARPPIEPSIFAKFDTVREGMTVEQVEEIMGPGERVARRDGTERLEWKQQLKGGTLTVYVSVKDRTVSTKGSELR